MSPKTKASILNITAVLGAIVAVIGITGSGVRFVDRRYVKADTFQIIQQGHATARTVDSITHNHELEEINRKLARLDTGITCLRRRTDPMCR